MSTEPDRRSGNTCRGKLGPVTAVSVFVDDAVRGKLPLVCAKTARPADLVIRMQSPVRGRLSPAWLLLLFLGPPGWLALFLVAVLTPGAEYLTVRVPQTEAAYYRERTLERIRFAAFGVGLASLAYAVLGAGGLPLVWLVLGGGFLLGAVAVHVMVQTQAIGVSLDASRRWVTLSGVHPEFVRAVEEREPAAMGAGR